jgi:hypothetical protein
LQKQIKLSKIYTKKIEIAGDLDKLSIASGLVTYYFDLNKMDKTYELFKKQVHFSMDKGLTVPK